jgi:DNA (cytosine-5)-methyltransferase 1
VNVLSVCTGVGGFDLGLERAGHRIVAQCEIDESGRAILARHWPGVPCFHDMRSVRLDRGRLTGTGSGVDAGGVTLAGGIDLLCGGTPCQDLSVAGRRAGLDGARSGLFFEFARIADELVRDGGWLLFENVPGLLSSPGGTRSGRDFAIVLATLADIGFHDLAWRVLDSRYFGVPQRRRRIYILGRRAVGGRAREVLLEPESGGGDFAPSREARARVADRTGDGVASALDQRRGGADDNDAQAGHLVAPALTRRYAKGTDSDATDALVAGPLMARSSRGKAQTLSPGHTTDNHIVAHTLRAEGFDASEDGTGRGTPLVAGTVRSHMRPGSNDNGGLAYALRRDPGGTGQGHNTTYVRVGEPTGGGSRDGAREAADGGRRQAGPGLPSDEDRFNGAPADPDRVRAPSELPRRVDDPKPDGPRYAQMGNAVTVNVAYWIGRRLADCERSRAAGALDACIDHTGHRIVTRSPDMAGRSVVICTTCNVRLPAPRGEQSR